uniref:Cystatin domain-containing protein n=1 Tax=Oreochromis aureus TaxID=47969 RepID=A0A668TFP2_OREAU
MNDGLTLCSFQVDGGCNVKLQLDLRETKCHTTNPKPFEDCEIREETARVNAKHDFWNPLNVHSLQFFAFAVNTNSEMVRICPDCPVLLPLNDSEGLKSVHEATTEFNKNTSNQHYYILKEVGRISSGYIMTSGMNYYAEFALVETHCPVGSRIVIEACTPLCPDRAVSTTHTLQKILSHILICCVLKLGSVEPDCRHHGRHRPHGHGHHHHHNGSGGRPPHAHDHGHGPPPPGGKGGRPPHSHGGPPPHAHDHGHGPPPHAHDHGHGPPPHAGKGGRPPHSHGGPPPHAHDHGHGPPPPGGKGKGSFHPLRRLHPCHGFLVNPDPALHPICPWPLPHRTHN